MHKWEGAELIKKEKMKSCRVQGSSENILGVEEGLKGLGCIH